MATSITQFSNKRLKVFISLFLVVLLTLPPVVNIFINNAKAAALTSYSLKINNSQAAATGVTYTFQWTVSATTDIKQIDIQICTTASGTCSAPSGFAAGNEPTLQADNIAGTGRTVTSPTDNAFRVVVTTPGTQTATTMSLVFTGVVNPSTVNSTYYARTTTYSDTGTSVIDGPTTTAFAVLDTTSIAVSATVDPLFTFTVAPVNTGTVNGDTINVGGVTAAAIPFGSLNTTTASVSAHDLTVVTNANNGYTITASTSATSQTGFPPLVSGATNNIDNFTGTNASPATWSAPNGGTANTDTGFFGYTTNDSTLCIGTVDRFTNGGPNYAGFSTVGREVACNSSPVTTETTRVGWKIAINALQPAGSYTGTVILVATPTY